MHRFNAKRLCMSIQKKLIVLISKIFLEAVHFKIDSKKSRKYDGIENDFTSFKN